MACCYCSYKFRQQDKEAEEYWRNRSKRTVPRIVIRGADDITSPLISGQSNQRRASNSSVANVLSPHRRSRSPSTHSNSEFRVGTPIEQSLPSSPPPPYSAVARGSSPTILPFASNPSPNHRSPSRPQSPHPEQIGTSQPSGNSNSIISASNEEPVVTHPDNPNLILPFATSAPNAI